MKCLNIDEKLDKRDLALVKIYLKHFSKEILRMKYSDIDEKLDKRDLALVKISDTGAGEEYGEAASYST